MSVATAYGEFLFHGPALHAFSEIAAVGPDGASASLRSRSRSASGSTTDPISLADGAARRRRRLPTGDSLEPIQSRRRVPSDQGRRLPAVRRNVMANRPASSERSRNSTRTPASATSNSSVRTERSSLGSKAASSSSIDRSTKRSSDLNAAPDHDRSTHRDHRRRRDLSRCAERFPRSGISSPPVARPHGNPSSGVGRFRSKKRTSRVVPRRTKSIPAAPAFSIRRFCRTRRTTCGRSTTS